MTLTVYMFSILAEEIGRRQVEISVPLPTTAADLLDHLAAEFDAVKDLRRVVRLAVNQEYADENQMVNEGDELALITPTSGG